MATGGLLNTGNVHQILKISDGKNVKYIKVERFIVSPRVPITQLQLASHLMSTDVFFKFLTLCWTMVDLQ